MGSCLHLLRPLPSVRLSPCEKTPLPGLSPPASPFPQWALTCQPPAFGGEKGPLKWLFPTSKRTQGACHFLRDEVCVPPSYQSRSPLHSPRGADRTCSKAPASWVSASTVCQSSKDPLPSPITSHASVCTSFCFYGFFEAI